MRTNRPVFFVVAGFFLSISTAVSSAQDVASATLNTEVSVGDVVFGADFSDPASRRMFQTTGDGVQFVSMDGDEDATVLYVEQPIAAGAGARHARASLPIQRLRGTRVMVEARIKAENVSQPPNAWNGIEVQLHIISPAGQRWTQKNNVYGSFDWRPVRFVVEIPSDATEASITLGLVPERRWYSIRVPSGTAWSVLTVTLWTATLGRMPGSCGQAAGPITGLTTSPAGG